MEDQAELQWRLSVPIAALMLTLLAVPISYTTPQRGKYGKIFVAILIFVIYYNLLTAAQYWLEVGNIPPRLGLWWVHGVLASVIAALLIWGGPRHRGRKTPGATAAKLP